MQAIVRVTIQYKYVKISSMQILKKLFLYLTRTD